MTRRDPGLVIQVLTSSLIRVDIDPTQIFQMFFGGGGMGGMGGMGGFPFSNMDQEGSQFFQSGGGGFPGNVKFTFTRR